MTEPDRIPHAGAAGETPPASFVEVMEVPASGYKTAVAIRHDSRMVKSEVTFTLRQRTADSATYEAVCPRCQEGRIDVTVRLNADGSFAESPACPTLCMACEDRLDDILEPGKKLPLEEQPKDRATLNAYIKAMSTRPWE